MQRGREGMEIKDKSKKRRGRRELQSEKKIEEREKKKKERRKKRKKNAPPRELNLSRSFSGIMSCQQDQRGIC